MSTGQLIHLPEAGAAWEQNPLLLECLSASWRTWYINEYKPVNHLPVTNADGDFMEAILPKDYQPVSQFDRRAVLETPQEWRHG